MSFYISLKNTTFRRITKKYRKMRNKILREISITKPDFFSNKVEGNKSDSKKLWQQLKSLGYKNKQNESSKIVLKIDNAMCHDPKRIAESFKIFFTNIASELVTKLQRKLGIFFYRIRIF